MLLKAATLRLPLIQVKPNWGREFSALFQVVRAGFRSDRLCILITP